MINHFYKIKNLKTNSFVSQIALSKDDQILALAFYRNNLVRIYNIRGEILKDLKINSPHAILIYKNWLIISSGYKSTSKILIYDLKNYKLNSKFYFNSKFNTFHSMALDKGLLCATICENENKVGALILFKFNCLIGKIISISQIIHKSFFNLGDAKGVCFDNTGKFIFVTFESAKINTYELVKNKLKFILFKEKFINITNKNGIALFERYKDDKVSPHPIKKIIFNPNSRIEDVKVYKNKLAISDFINNTVYLYKIHNNFKLELTRTITHNLNSPHGMCFYNSGKKLLVSNTFIKVIDGKALFWLYNKSSLNSITSFNS
jgi:hypothetical protein